MTPSPALRYWRWTFIIVETMVATSFIVGVIIAPLFGWQGPLNPPALAMAHAIFVTLAWLFLLIASPFFLPSFRGVALTGLFIALGILVYSVMTFS